MFTKATKKQSKLRLALIGVSGSGKTYTALKLATNLGERVAVIDTERGSASKYSDMFSFDVLELDSYEPQNYILAIQEAEKSDYDVIIIDSLTHAWNAKGGILEQHEKATLRQKTQNSYTAWRDVTPIHNDLVNTIIQSKIHIIATMRAKTEYVQEKDDKGKTTIRKVGLAPIQRDGMEYEFDVVADMDTDNNMIITKSRCFAMSGQFYRKPDEKVAKIMRDWLSDGEPIKEKISNNKIRDISYNLENLIEAIQFATNLNELETLFKDAYLKVGKDGDKEDMAKIMKSKDARKAFLNEQNNDIV